MRKRLLSASFIVLVTITTSAQWLSPKGIPAYHSTAPRKADKLPPILPASQRTGPYFQYKFQTLSYQLAEKHQAVLHQQPCYCYCDRGHGHKSLRSCFQDTHGATCAACMKEVFYTDQMLKQKKTPAQIRAGIIKGDWQQIDLERMGQ
jgi:hypothetical protein